MILKKIIEIIRDGKFWSNIIRLQKAKHLFYPENWKQTKSTIGVYWF